jgi:hypothetical protein
LLCRYIHGYGTITYCQLYVPATPGNQQVLRGYIHGYGTTIVGMLLCMPRYSLLILILIFIQSSKEGKWNCHLSFYNLRDQFFPSIYPWLQNRCLAINNSSLLVSKDISISNKSRDMFYRSISVLLVLLQIASKIIGRLGRVGGTPASYSRCSGFRHQRINRLSWQVFFRFPQAINKLVCANLYIWLQQQIFTIGIQERKNFIRNI